MSLKRITLYRYERNGNLLGVRLRSSRSSVIHVAMTPVRLRVRELREAKGLTGAELARLAKVRPSTLSAIENDQTTSIAFAVLDRIATALGIDAAMLIIHTGREGRQKR